jgi:hypothetical protein
MVAAISALGACASCGPDHQRTRPVGSDVAASPRSAGTGSPSSSPSQDRRLRLVRTPRQIGRAVLADVDGDGRVDRAALYRGWRYPWGWQDMLIVRFANGAHQRLPIDEEGDYRYPFSRLLGSADVNGDHRWELVLLTGGNTSYFGDIVTEVRNRLAVATTKRDPASGITNGSPLFFFAHGNACGPWCDLTSSCQTVHGQQRLVTVWASSLWNPQEPTRPPRGRRWQVTVYRLAGARLIEVGRQRGMTPRGRQLPAAWPFLNKLSCGTADWPTFTPERR